MIINLLKIRPEYIKELEINQGHVMKLDAHETFTVTLIDANHCYGAVMFLFEGYNFKNIFKKNYFYKN